MIELNTLCGDKTIYANKQLQYYKGINIIIIKLNNTLHGGQGKNNANNYNNKY